MAAAPPATQDVSVSVSGLRSTRGLVLACLSPGPQGFPDCSRDPQARKLAVPASQAARIDFGMVPPGTYAIALVHDENGNRRMDKTLILPREGFGFSRDAPVRFGPPSFAAAAFAVASQPVRQTVKMRYMF